MKLPVFYNRLTPHERRSVREEYICLQKGLCHHCGQLLTGQPSMEILEKWVDEDLFPDSFFQWPVHLHHSHETGLTIGAVHARCNAVLWQYHGE